ncbi:MAG TPA: hypothetical protein VGI81_15680 [Tepidisphaeraceae bacterium]|jgi:hypothetical protein
MKSSKMLAFVLVMQVVIVIGQWAGQPAARTAHADVNIPNPGERQLAILDELRTLNGKMDRLLTVVQSGDMKVEVTKVDRNK